MSTLEQLLQSPEPGLHRVQQARATVLRLARQAGYRVIDLDTRDCHSKGDVLRRCAQAFAFPEWFGHNWDALEEALRDLPGPGEQRGYAVIWAGLDQLPARVAQTASQILTERSRMFVGVPACLLVIPA